MRKKIVLGCVLLLVCLLADAQKIVIKGVVTDSISGEALPYASLMLKGWRMMPSQYQPLGTSP